MVLRAWEMSMCDFSWVLWNSAGKQRVVMSMFAYLRDTNLSYSTATDKGHRPMESTSYISYGLWWERIWWDTSHLLSPTSFHILPFPLSPCMYVCLCVRASVYMHVPMFVHVCVCACAFVHLPVYVCSMSIRSPEKDTGLLSGQGIRLHVLIYFTQQLFLLTGSSPQAQWLSLLKDYLD